MVDNAFTNVNELNLITNVAIKTTDLMFQINKVIIWTYSACQTSGTCL